MAYNEVVKRATLKYMKNKVKSINLRIKKDEFEQNIKPAITSSGLPTNTFIKQAIYEKIAREYPSQNTSAEKSVEV